MSDHKPKVGDPVYLRESAGWSSWRYKRAKITAIATTGQATVIAEGESKPRKFRKSGYEFGSSDYHGWLLDFDVAKCERAQAEQEQQDNSRRSFLPVRKLVEGIRGEVTPAEKAELLKLVEAIVTVGEQ